jgi:hypothetical protein
MACRAWQMRGRRTNGDRPRQTVANAFVQVSLRMPTMTGNSS